MGWFLYDNGLRHERVKGFKTDFLFILIEISSWPLALLFMFRALIIWRSSPLLKSKDPR